MQLNNLKKNKNKTARIRTCQSDEHDTNPGAPESLSGASGACRWEATDRCTAEGKALATEAFGWASHVGAYYQILAKEKAWVVLCVLSVLT